MSAQSRPDDRRTISSGKGIITVSVYHEGTHDRVDVQYDGTTESFRIADGEATYQGVGDPEHWAHNTIRDMGARLG